MNHYRENNGEKKKTRETQILLHLIQPWTSGPNAKSRRRIISREGANIHGASRDLVKVKKKAGYLGRGKAKLVATAGETWENEQQQRVIDFVKIVITRLSLSAQLCFEMVAIQRKQALVERILGFHFGSYSYI